MSNDDHTDMPETDRTPILDPADRVYAQRQRQRQQAHQQADDSSADGPTAETVTDAQNTARADGGYVGADPETVRDAVSEVDLE